MKRYKFLDHTADIGIMAFGKDLREAFANAAFAMFDILTDTDKIREVEQFNIKVSARNIEELLVRWLDELLYQYETGRIVFKRFHIEDIDNAGLRATAFGEKIDRARHRIKVEIKNITYHQLKVEKSKSYWRLQVIFDV